MLWDEAVFKERMLSRGICLVAKLEWGVFIFPSCNAIKFWIKDNKILDQSSVRSHN